MRDFTPEEKELIINTPIDCEDLSILGYDDENFTDFLYSVGVNIIHKNILSSYLSKIKIGVAPRLFNLRRG